MINLGKRLNTTEHGYPCPEEGCGSDDTRPIQLAVHENGVRWPCGHVRSLPPLTRQTPKHALKEPQRRGKR